jgi:hypothetical protein
MQMTGRTDREDSLINKRPVLVVSNEEGAIIR